MSEIGRREEVTPGDVITDTVDIVQLLRWKWNFATTRYRETFLRHGKENGPVSFEMSQERVFNSTVLQAFGEIITSRSRGTRV